MAETPNTKRFCLDLIMPSHYDDDGYVIQWNRSAIPSNSLACLYGLSLECAAENILGSDTEFEIHALDETNTKIDPAKGPQESPPRNADRKPFDFLSKVFLSIARQAVLLDLVIFADATDLSQSPKRPCAF